VDKRLYLEINRFATRTAWAHGVIAFFARPSALLILAILVVLALVRARAVGLGGNDPDQLAALLWVVIGTGIAFAISLPISHLVGRLRPFVAMPQVAVLIPIPSGFSFPNGQAVIGGAVAAGLWLSGARLIASLATVTAMLMAFGVVYTGVAYPGDALAGLLLGALVVLALYPFAIGSLREAVHAIGRSPFRVLVGGAHHSRPVGPGPAARPEPIGESGAVRILPPNEAGSGKAGASASPK
jgi:undecaprenyl-diphosphatase